MLITETKRLRILSWEESHIPQYQEMSKDVGYNAFAFPGYYLVKNDEEGLEKIRLRMRLFEERGLGKFPLFLKNTGEFVGTCGMDPYVVNGKEEFELGYRLCLAHWGKGYATESAQALLDHVFKNLHLKKVLAFAVPQNQASLRVIEKLSFTPVGEIAHAGIPHKLFEKQNPYSLK